MSALSVIEIGIDPTIELGPVTLAWHGTTTSSRGGCGWIAGSGGNSVATRPPETGRKRTRS